MPRPNVDRAITRMIQNRLSERTISRTSKQINGLGESVDGNTTDHTEKIHLYRKSKSDSFLDAGEQDDGTIMGLCLPDADILEGDIVPYHGDMYEIDDKIPLPDDKNTNYYRLVLSLDQS